LGQAKNWQANLQAHINVGLCHRCAAQVAWGIQIGFKHLEHSPCRECEPIINMLPRSTSNLKWRRR
jgi:hypothetical protein